MGSFTQFPSAASDECDIVVGFDFGTSCSKVVLRTPYHFGGQAYAVPFASLGHPHCRYLLPSLLWADDAGNVTIARSANGVLLRDIKHHLFKGQPMPSVNGQGKTYDTQVVAVAFLAIALREARKWFIANYKERYGKLKLRWSFNLGMPSADYADIAMCGTYEKIAGAAWWLSVQTCPVTLHSAEDALASPDRWDDLEEVDAAEVTPILEVAAEVEGYRRSNVRDDGLHLLVDIGATTVDVCSFVLHRNAGDYEYGMLTADVDPIGAMELFRTRVDAVHQAVNDHVRGLRDEYDPVNPMSDDLAAYSPDQDELAAALHKSDVAYTTQVRRMIWKTIMDLKLKRDPNSSRWISELPVFVSGGGSAMPFYMAVMQKVSDSLHALFTDCGGIRPLSLQKPVNLVAEVDDQTYHRLAVAWGLSFPKVDIGDVTRPGDIADIEPKERIDPYEGFVSKDMV